LSDEIELTPATRDAEQVRARFSSFQAATSRGREGGSPSAPDGEGSGEVTR
jgi:hypothetical protein